MIEKLRKLIDKEIAKYPADKKQSAVIAALAIMQHHRGWLSQEDISDVAIYLDMPEIAVLEVATFYNMFDLKAVGKYKLSICTDISCMLRDADHIVNHLKENLKIDFNEVTKDGKFCLKESECMGACGGAPLLTINNQKMYENLDMPKIDSLLKELK